MLERTQIRKRETTLSGIWSPDVKHVHLLPLPLYLHQRLPSDLQVSNRLSGRLEWPNTQQLVGICALRAGQSILSVSLSLSSLQLVHLLLVHFYLSEYCVELLQSKTQIHKYKYTKTKTQIQTQKHKNTKTQKHKNTKTQIQIHKHKNTSLTLR